MSLAAVINMESKKLFLVYLLAYFQTKPPTPLMKPWLVWTLYIANKRKTASKNYPYLVRIPHFIHIPHNHLPRFTMVLHMTATLDTAMRNAC